MQNYRLSGTKGDTLKIYFHLNSQPHRGYTAY